MERADFRGVERSAVCAPGLRRILVVDDSAAQRRVLRAQLERTGLSVAEAASGDAALAICAGATPPDLVLSDWMMPGMSGIDFCRALRALDLPHYIYFILLTSRSDKADVARGLDVGADDFLTKPVNGAELRARIAAGERIVRMQRELSGQNRLMGETLDEMRRLHDSINSDLVEARKFQQSLVRDRYRSFGASAVSLLLRPSGHVGGDLVGVFPINAGRIGLYALDVSGHGIASALMTARLAGYLSGDSPEQNIALVATDGGGQDAQPPDRFAAQLNRIVTDEMQSDAYFTLAYADIDLGTGRIALLQAGHPHPAILRAGGGVEFVGEGGLPLGLFRDATFTPTQSVLSPGDRLILMSDGVTEARDPAGEELGEAGLARLIAKRAKLSGTDFLDALVADLAGFTGADFADDVSFAQFDFAR